MQTEALVEELQRAGWDPFDPSEECRKATDLPVMKDHLTELDRLGIYYRYLVLRLFVRFGKGTSYRGQRGEDLMHIAVLFALRRSNLRDRLTHELVARFSRRIQSWQERDLAQASRLMDATAGDVVMKSRRSCLCSIAPRVTR